MMKHARKRPRADLTDMARGMLATLARLEKAGCQVQQAALLPMPRLTIDRPPKWLDTYGYVRPVPWMPRAPVQHYAVLDGVWVGWTQTAGGRRHG